MKPTTFKQSTVVYAANQPQYLPLPVHKTPKGVVISCWKLSLWEQIVVAFTGHIFISNLTFNQPLQPQLPSVKFEVQE